MYINYSLQNFLFRIVIGNISASCDASSANQRVAVTCIRRTHRHIITGAVRDGKEARYAHF